jgi:hypothetical protein
MGLEQQQKFGAKRHFCHLDSSVVGQISLFIGNGAKLVRQITVTLLSKERVSPLATGATPASSHHMSMAAPQAGCTRTGP